MFASCDAHLDCPPLHPTERRCTVSIQDQNLGSRSPFGRLPIDLAGRLTGNAGSPFLQRGLDALGPGRTRRFEKRLERAGGPEADIIRGFRDIIPSTINQGQEISQNILSASPARFAQLTQQVDQVLRDIPGLQDAIRSSTAEGIGNVRGAIEQLASQVQPLFTEGAALTAQQARELNDPIQSSALFNRLSEDVLRPLASNAAARGLAGTGAAQAQESEVLRDLGLDFLLNREGLRGQANQALLGAAGQGGELAQLRAALGGQIPGLENASAQLIGQLGELGLLAGGTGTDALTSQLALESGAAGLPLQLLLGGQQGIEGARAPGLERLLQLLQITAPVVGTSGSRVGVFK